MTWPAPDTEDDSDRERRRRAVAGRRRRLVEALQLLPWRLRDVDRGFLIRLGKSDLAVMTQPDRDRLDRLAWRHRAGLAPELRPKLPQYDPIVREMEAVDV